MVYLALIVLVTNIAVITFFLSPRNPSASAGLVALGAVAVGLGTVALMPLIAPAVAALVALLVFMSALATLTLTLIFYAQACWE